MRLIQKTIRPLARGTLLAALSLAWCVTPGWAAQPAPPAAAPTSGSPPAGAAAIKQNLESRYPGVHVLDVKPSAMPNVYEVYLGSELLYTDANADYLLACAAQILTGKARRSPSSGRNPIRP